MKRRVLAAAFACLAITAAPCRAGGNSVSGCLETKYPSACLIDAAASRLAKGTDGESLSEGYEALLMALARTGIRRYDVFSKSGNVAGASLLRQWQLAVARRSYLLAHFAPSTAPDDDPAKLEALALALRPRFDGAELIVFVGSACESREGLPERVVAGWNGMADRLCGFFPEDAERLNNVMPGLPRMLGPLIGAYWRDDERLRMSLPGALEVLARYTDALADKKLTKAERDAVRRTIFIGNLLNATAFAMAGQPANAETALKPALIALKLLPKKEASELAVSAAQMSWVMAKAGMRDDAVKWVRDSLGRVDTENKMPLADQAAVISSCVETLFVLNRGY